MNWIFSFRIQFVGLDVICGLISGGRVRAVLDILDGYKEGLRVNKMSARKHAFDNNRKDKIVKNVSHCQTTQYPIHWNGKIQILPVVEEKC